MSFQSVSQCIVVINGAGVYCAVTSNDDEGIDIDDHGAASLSVPDNVNGVGDDFSDAGRRVLSHATEHSVIMCERFL